MIGLEIRVYFSSAVLYRHTPIHELYLKSSFPLTYRRLRPSSRCSQRTPARDFSLDVSSAKKRSKHSVSKHLSDALDYSLDFCRFIYEASQCRANGSCRVRPASVPTPQSLLCNELGGTGRGTNGAQTPGYRDGEARSDAGESKGCGWWVDGN